MSAVNCAPTVPPSVDRVETVGEGGVRRLQLIYLLLAVPDLNGSILRGGERGVEIDTYSMTMITVDQI